MQSLVVFVCFVSLSAAAVSPCWLVGNTVARLPQPGAGYEMLSKFRATTGAPMVWNTAGVPSGYNATSECIKIDSGLNSWNDNWLCSRISDLFVGWTFSAAGTLSTTMYSVRLYERSLAATADDYLYIPKTSKWAFAFSDVGLIQGIPAANCTLMAEIVTPEWNNNYLCMYSTSYAGYSSGPFPQVIGTVTTATMARTFYLAGKLVYYYESIRDTNIVSRIRIVPFVTAEYAYMATDIATNNEWTSGSQLVFTDIYAAQTGAAHTYSVYVSNIGEFALPVRIPGVIRLPFSAFVHLGSLVTVWIAGSQLIVTTYSGNTFTERSMSPFYGSPSGMIICARGSSRSIQCLYRRGSQGLSVASLVGYPGSTMLEWQDVGTSISGASGIAGAATSTTRSVMAYMSGSSLMLRRSPSYQLDFVSQSVVSLCTIDGSILTFGIMKDPHTPVNAEVYIIDAITGTGPKRCRVGVADGNLACVCKVVEKVATFGDYLVYTSDPQPDFCANHCLHKSCWSHATGEYDIGGSVLVHRDKNVNDTHIRMQLQSQYGSAKSLRNYADALGGVYQGHVITGDLTHETKKKDMRTWYNDWMPMLKRDFAPLIALRGNHDGVNEQGDGAGMQLTTYYYYMKQMCDKYHCHSTHETDEISLVGGATRLIKGSAAYSIQRGKYLILNLQDNPTEHISRGDSIVAAFNKETRNRAAAKIYRHRITECLTWAAKELAYARASGLRVIINMHMDGESDEGNRSPTATISQANNIFTYYQDIIAAVFVGHYHWNQGQLNTNGNYHTLQSPIVYVGSRDFATYLIVRLGDAEIETIPIENTPNGDWQLLPPSKHCVYGPCYEGRIGVFGSYALPPMTP